MAVDFQQLLIQFKRCKQLLAGELAKSIIGQQEVVDQLLAAVLARGHCLLVGVPGLAKTLLVSSLAKTLTLSFKRIQFTPDLMPADITGTLVVDELPGEGASRRREFRFVKGPVFANIVLADEINRAPPKTQSALLEAMQEKQVTVGQDTHALPAPFFVIATQNPIEQEGTYPLPEAQQDRFMFNIHVDYPALDEEERILSATTAGERPSPAVVLNDRQLTNMQKVVQWIAVSPYVVGYVARLIRATRPADATAPDFVRKMVDFGAGPRAGQHLIWGAKALAAMDGRPAVSCDDIRRCAVPALRHRLGLNFTAQAEGLDAVALVKRILSTVPEPTVPMYAPEKVVAPATAPDAMPDALVRALRAGLSLPGDASEAEPFQPVNLPKL